MTWRSRRSAAHPGPGPPQPEGGNTERRLRSQVQVCPARLRLLEAPTPSPTAGLRDTEEEQQGLREGQTDDPRVHRAAQRTSSSRPTGSWEKELQNVAERNHILEEKLQALQADYQRCSSGRRPARAPWPLWSQSRRRQSCGPTQAEKEAGSAEQGGRDPDRELQALEGQCQQTQLTETPQGRRRPTGSQPP